MPNSILKNASFLFISHFAGRLLSFILTIILPRYLTGGFDDLGKFFFALWFTNLLATLTELGLHTPLIRDVAADKSKASLMISNALMIRLVLSVVTFLIIVVSVKFLYPGEIGILIYIIGFSEIINAITQLLRCIFRSFESMEFEALGVILERLLVFSMGMGAVFLGYGVIGLCMVVLIASVLNLIMTFLIMILKFSRIDFGILDARLCMNLLRQSLPFALSSILYMAYFRLDGILLKQIMGADGNLTMGWYGTGYSFVNAFTIIPGAFMGAVFPVMSRAISLSVRELKGNSLAIDFLYTRSMKLMLAIALPLAIGITFLADDIVMILYPAGRFNPQDREALSLILKVLIWPGAMLFFNTVLLTVFRAADKRKAFSILVAVILGVNTISNLALIPRYSYLGASISMVISESLFLIYGLWYVHRYMCKFNEVGFLIKLAFASGILASTLFAWKYISWINGKIPFILAACFSIVLYCAIVFLLRVIDRADIAMIKGKLSNFNLE